MNKIIAIFALLLLVSCASDEPPPVKQDVDTSPKISLDVLTVVVLDRTNQIGMPTPYTTNNFQPTITNALRKWVNEKIVAVGTTGEAIVVIRDASLKSDAIPHPDSMFTREQTSKYTGHAQIEVNVTRRGDHGQVSAESTQFSTLPEDPTTQERQNAYTKLLNALMRDVTANLRSGISKHLDAFMAPSAVQQ